MIPLFRLFFMHPVRLQATERSPLKIGRHFDAFLTCLKQKCFEKTLNFPHICSVSFFKIG